MKKTIPDRLYIDHGFPGQIVDEHGVMVFACYVLSTSDYDRFALTQTAVARYNAFADFEKNIEALHRGPRNRDSWVLTEKDQAPRGNMVDRLKRTLRRWLGPVLASLSTTPMGRTTTDEQDNERLRKLEDVVKRVLAQTGDDHCWRDIYTEMAGLVGVKFVPEILDDPTMLRNCKHFIGCLRSGEHYLAPSVAETEQLRAENAALERRAEFYLDRWRETETTLREHVFPKVRIKPLISPEQFVENAVLEWERVDTATFPPVNKKGTP